jgi:hypothetical protein
MFATSRAEVIPREKSVTRAHKVMLTSFFNGASLMTLDALPSGARFNQEYFRQHMLCEMVDVIGRFSLDFAGVYFCVHGQFHGPKVTDQLDNLKLDRVPHPPYSPDLSPCDFWLFEMFKQKIKNRMF